MKWLPTNFFRLSDAIKSEVLLSSAQLQSSGITSRTVSESDRRLCGTIHTFLSSSIRLRSAPVVACLGILP